MLLTQNDYIYATMFTLVSFYIVKTPYEPDATRRVYRHFVLVCDSQEIELTYIIANGSHFDCNEVYPPKLRALQMQNLYSHLSLIALKFAKQV